MHFGSDEMKDLLLLARDNPKYHDKAMEALFESVNDYTMSRLASGYVADSNGKKSLTTHNIAYQD